MCNNSACIRIHSDSVLIISQELDLRVLKVNADEKPSNKSLVKMTPSKHFLLAQTWLHDSTVPCLRIDKVTQSRCHCDTNCGQF